MEDSPKRKSIKKSKKGHRNSWPYIVLIVSILLSFGFSILSEFVLGGSGIVVAIIVIVMFVALAIITDMIGVAVAACPKEPFMAMCSKKVRGAKEGLLLVKNADKVASICADIVGDVCGILSGAAGASIVAKLSIETGNAFVAILVASLVSALIAGVTIFGKALGKKQAMTNCTAIILRVGVILSFFRKNPKLKKKEVQKALPEDELKENNAQE